MGERIVKRRELPPEETEREFDPLGYFRGDLRQPTVIGIDSSATNFGLCVLGLTTGEAHAWTFKSKQRGTLRLHEIEQWLLSTLNKISLRASSVELSAMEGYAFSRQMAHMLGEVGGVAKLCMLKNFGYRHPAAIPVVVAPPALKKFVTGKGNTEKSDMKLSIFKKWGVEFRDDNQADAYGLCHVASALVHGVTGHAYEQDVIDKLERHQWDSPPTQTST